LNGVKLNKEDVRKEKKKIKFRGHFDISAKLKGGICS